jgi:NADPH-dependent 2,4-dienoyl-CoA reductase/sulfur reductase-like enzyme
MRCHDSSILEHHFLCAVNPVIGMEHVLQKTIKAPKAVKKVAVVGGGPAGMQAALTAAQRGHDVTLYEKNMELGGNIAFAEYVSFKYPLKYYRNYMVRQIGKSNVKVKFNTRATHQMLRQEGFNVVVAALGAQPVQPRFPGTENRSVRNALDIYGKEDELGKNVIVIGGGQVGCETALHLAKLGKQVTVIEMLSDIAPDSSPTHRNELVNELNWEPNLVFVTGAKCERITERGIEYSPLKGIYTGVHNGEDKNTSRTLGATDAHTFKNESYVSDSIEEGKLIELESDDIVMAIGMEARREESLAFFGAADRFVMVGDCNKARTVESAVKEGYYAAINI